MGEVGLGAPPFQGPRFSRPPRGCWARGRSGLTAKSVYFCHMHTGKWPGRKKPRPTECQRVAQGHCDQGPSFLVGLFPRELQR